MRGGEEYWEEQEVRVIEELCSLIMKRVKLPPLPSPFPRTLSRCSRRELWWQNWAAAFACLFLGMSLSLMLLGSLTFLLGLLLLPWVTLSLLLFYFASLLSHFSLFARFVLASITFHVKPFIYTLEAL